MLKPQVDFIQLFKKLATDLELDTLTVSYCVRRLRAEGLRFWTVTLPKVTRWVLQSIEAGSLIQDPLVKPTHLAWKGLSLLYFGSLIDRIFCRKTGNLLLAPSAEALFCLRQLCEYTYKLALEFSPEQLESAVNDYEKNQKRLSTLDESFNVHKTALELDRLRKFAETNYPYLFKGSPDFALSFGPRFGPGSFAGSEAVSYPFYEWKLLRDEVIGTTATSFSPYSGYFKPYPSSPTKINVVETSKTAEILFVPKDSRGPRTISKEPPHLLKAQMAFFSWLSHMLSSMTGNRVNFTDQTLNQRLAFESSVTRQLATCDFKDASDSVSAKAIKRIFKGSPIIRWFMSHARSRHVKLPNGNCISQRAVAGMGSGLTFPIMSLWIHLIVCYYACRHTGYSYSDVARSVYIFGDDLIVPSEWVPFLVPYLCQFGMNLNLNKTFYRGPFRESCGTDYLCGKEVTPTRITLKNCGVSVKHRSGKILIDGCIESNLILSLSAHAQELRKKGLFSTAMYLEDSLARIVPMPWVGAGSGVVGRLTEDTNTIVRQGRFDADLGMQTIKVCRSSSVNLLSKEVCPYKFLGSRLKESGPAGPFIDCRLSPRAQLTSVIKQLPIYLESISDSRPAAFGEVPVPRKTKLKFRVLPVTALFPVYE